MSLLWRLLVVPAAVLVGVCASFVHAGTVSVTGVRLPAGLVLAWAATGALLVLAHLTAGSRWMVAAVGAGWLLAVVMLALPRPEGDVVIAGDLLGVAFVLGGVVVVGVAVGLPAGGLR